MFIQQSSQLAATYSGRPLPHLGPPPTLPNRVCCRMPPTQSIRLSYSRRPLLFAGSFTGSSWLFLAVIGCSLVVHWLLIGYELAVTGWLGCRWD